MHVSSLAKALRIIIYTSVSSSMSQPYWPGVWQLMYDFSLPRPHVLCQSVPMLISTCQIQTLTQRWLNMLRSLRGPWDVFFTLLWTVTATSKSSPCLHSLYVSATFHLRRHSSCEVACHNVNVAHKIIQIFSTKTDRSASCQWNLTKNVYIYYGCWKYCSGVFKMTGKHC